ncbi:TPA: hypothetical protein PNO69_004474 [Salmonella enterica]|nr:hypothetical protein [Salmonella enterica]HCH9607917.1 hypothetical protein [Salmonella enterica]HDI5000211.1 hypothetical protein [Salmonella enterica]HDI5005032.1 hypothetical protein [Salmonella enterica]
MSDLGELLQKTIILDKVHDNVLARLSGIDNSGGNSENQTELLKLEKLILKKYKEIISEL